MRKRTRSYVRGVTVRPGGKAMNGMDGECEGSVRWKRNLSEARKSGCV